MLEVQIPEFPVKMKEIIEILDMMTIGVPDYIVFIPGYGSALKPPFLYFFKMLIGAVYIFLNIE